MFRYIRIQIHIFLAIVWRFINRIRLSRKKVRIDKGVAFNQRTKFGMNIWIHNHTNVNSTEIGSYTYIQNNCILQRCKIGSFCSIGDNVKVLSGNHPTRTFVSTSPVFYSSGRQCIDSFVQKTYFEEYRRINGYNIIVGHDVWIGSNVTILGGITIGTGSIVGACSFVNKDVPPYSIVAGNPARIIRYRFNQEYIDVLLSSEWWNKPVGWMKDNISLFHNIDDLIKYFTYDT